MAKQAPTPKAARLFAATRFAQLAVLAACQISLLSAQQLPLHLDAESSDLTEALTFRIWSDHPEHSVAVEQCRGSDLQCAVITANGGTVQMMYSLDTTSFRGKQVRFAASLLVDYPAISRAQLFIRVDRPAGVGLHKYTDGRRDTQSDWTPREIIGTVDADAKRITIGLRFSGSGTVSLAKPELKLVSD